MSLYLYGIRIYEVFLRLLETSLITYLHLHQKYPKIVKTS